MASNNTNTDKANETHAVDFSRPATEADIIQLIAELGISPSYTSYTEPRHDPNTSPSPSPEPAPAPHRKTIKPPILLHSLSGRPHPERPYVPNKLNCRACCICRKNWNGMSISFVDGEKCELCFHSGCTNCTRFRRITNEPLGA
jgi:hypothetical protein